MQIHFGSKTVGCRLTFVVKQCAILEEPDDNIDFDCETVVGDNHDVGFKTPDKAKEKFKESNVRSFVLRLKRKKVFFAMLLVILVLIWG